MEAKLQITKEQIANLLCSAFEGGSNYWYMIVRHIEPTTRERFTGLDHYYPHIDHPLSPGGAIVIETLEKDEINGQKEWTLDYAACEKGLQVMAEKYPSHFADFIQEEEDATTGDVYLQCCLFGEVVFG